MQERVIPPDLLLGTAPLSDLAERHTTAKRDRDGGGKTLSIIPEVEGCQSIPAGIRRGEGESLGSPATMKDRSDFRILSDAQRAGGKLDVERQATMHESVAATLKTQRSERAVQEVRRVDSQEDEVDIERRRRAFGVQIGARTPGQHSTDSGAPKHVAHRSGHVSQ